MRILTLRPIKRFAIKHPDSKTALVHWYREMKQREFANFAELRSIFPDANRVGKLTVFNIGGNKYRLITAIHYNRNRIYIRAILTHQEYDRGDWKE